MELSGWESTLEILVEILREQFLLEFLMLFPLALEFL